MLSYRLCYIILYYPYQLSIAVFGQSFDLNNAINLKYFDQLLENF